MIFEDGTCPTLPIVRKFIKLAHDTIAKDKSIAVHCKAGLGRTGCLIGAYLIYRHGFTANEVIGFMRFMRPGMVVGPQQHWLHLNQGKFREWYLEDQWKTKIEVAKPVTPRAMSTKTPMRIASAGAQQATPDRSSARRSALGEIDGNDVNNPGAYQDENLPAPTPGQPRKYSRMDPRSHPYSRSTSGTVRVKPESEVIVETHRHSVNGADSEEELILQRAASRRSHSKSPVSSKGKGRSVSYTTTTTTVTKSFDMADDMNIYEDDGDVNFQLEDTNAIWDELAQEQENLKLSTVGEKTKTPRSASGKGAMNVSKTRSLRESPRRSGGEDKTKVRKTSGRVGSASHGPVGVKR
jgi:cell division cycle 14